MEKDQLAEKALILALTAGRRFLVLAWVAGLIALFGVVAWFINRVHLMAALLAIAVLLAYVLNPVIEFLCHRVALVIPTRVRLHRRLPALPLSRRPHTLVFIPRGMPRVAAILLVYAVLAILIALSVIYLIPVVNQQFAGLTQNLTNLFAHLQGTLVTWIHWLEKRAPAFLTPLLKQFDPRSIRMERFAADIQASLPNIMGTTLGGVFSGVKFAVGTLTTAVLVPVLSFYILLDGDRYTRSFMRLVPRRWKDETRMLVTEIDQMLGRYIRGQLLVCVTIGFAIAVALSALRVEYAILIGIFAGLVDVIPYVGVAVGLIPALIVALVQHGLLFALLVLGVLETIHWLEGHLVVPGVIGHSVGLPPLIVIVALGVGAELGGIMGMVLAIPAAAIIRVLGNHYADQLEAAELKAERQGRPGQQQPGPQSDQSVDEPERAVH